MKVLSTKGWSVEESEPEFTQTYDTSGYAKAAEEKAKRKDETPDTDTVSGGGWTVPTSEAGIAETTDAYKAPEKTKYKYTMDSLETNDEWNKHANTIYKHESGGKEYSADEEGLNQ